MVIYIIFFLIAILFLSGILNFKYIESIDKRDVKCTQCDYCRGFNFNEIIEKIDRIEFLNDYPDVKFSEHAFFDVTSLWKGYELKRGFIYKGQFLGTIVSEARKKLKDLKDFEAINYKSKKK